MPIIEVNGIKIHTQEINQSAKESVIMLHGMFTNLSIFYFNIAPTIAQNYHVVMYDLKGHGMSEGVATGYDFTSMTDDLLAVMDTLGLESVNLVGYSYGALIAMQMAIRFPEKIKKLVLIEAPNPSDMETLERMNTYSKEALFRFVNNHVNATDVRIGKRQLEKNHKRYQFLFEESSLKKDLHRERNFFSAGGIQKIQHDTLLIYGNASDCVSAGSDLLQKIERSKLIWVDGDHTIPMKEPVIIAKEIKEFLEAKDLK